MNVSFIMFQIEIYVLCIVPNALQTQVQVEVKNNGTSSYQSQTLMEKYCNVLLPSCSSQSCLAFTVNSSIQEQETV